MHVTFRRSIVKLLQLYNMHYSIKKKKNPALQKSPAWQKSPVNSVAETHLIYMVSGVVKISGSLIKIIYCRLKHFQKLFLKYRK